MRKLSILSLTAFAAAFMAIVPAQTTQAAVYTFAIPAGMMSNGNNSFGGNNVFGGNNSFGGNNGNCVNPMGNLINFGQNNNNGPICQDILNGQNCTGGQGCQNIFSLSCENQEHPNCQNGCDTIPGFPNGSGQPALPGGDLVTPSLPGGDQVTPSLPGDSSSYAAEILSLVNAERAKAGVSPLTIDASAERAANTRAQEIQQSFSHTRPNGSGFSSALTEAGVSFRASGENIAYGQNSPQEVMQVWMNSEGHRANILKRDFTSIGIGHTETGNGVDYWTQLFVN